jgi:hypothetical protein
LTSSADLGCARIEACVIDVVDDLEWIYAARPQHIIVCVRYGTPRNIEQNCSNPSRDRYPSQHDNYQEEVQEGL